MVSQESANRPTNGDESSRKIAHMILKLNSSTVNMSLFIFYHYAIFDLIIFVYQDFLDSATYWWPYWILMAILKFYNHMNIEIKIVDPENLR